MSRYNQLIALAEDMSRLAIADGMQPGLRYKEAIWELALCIREELKALRTTAGGLKPLEFHYTMRDALWDVEKCAWCRSMVGPDCPNNCTIKLR